MSQCRTCKHWLIRQENNYENGETIVKWSAPEGKGKCQILNMITDPDFGCIKYGKGGPFVKSRYKIGEPWHYSVGGPCPDCKHPYCGYPNCTSERCPGPEHCHGRGTVTGGQDDRCVGTGLVSYYDDGYIGENKTKKHPKELQGFLRPGTAAPSCMNCKFEINERWNICPNCGKSLKEPMSNTELIGDKNANMGAF